MEISGIKNLGSVFVFEKFEFFESEKKLELVYSFDSKEFFTETILFEFDFVKNYSKEALEKAFFGLFVMTGISYFKAKLPPKLIFKTQQITKEQKQFFEKIYTHGLGEFFFQNKINPKGKINFEALSEAKLESVSLPNLKDSIVPIGGGKDSLTTIALLQKSKQKIDTWTVNSDEKFETQIQKIHAISHGNHLKIQRKIDPKLLELNKKGGLNGHVPISSILAFLSVCTAILTGKKNILLSNENSANEATTEQFGMKINHQYSKTLEFETDFQDYVKKFISPEIDYFSFLRPLTELQIAEIFCEAMLDKYFEDFSSCNRNFKIKEKKQKFTWCGECPKCAFVFTIFSPFVSKSKLIKLFGANLFEKESLTETFCELLGLRKQKPFECVGEVLEVRKAMRLAQKDFPEVERFLSKLSLEQKQEANDFDYQKHHSHSIKNDFELLLKKKLV